MRQWGMPDPSRLLAQRLQPAFDGLLPGADPVLRDSDHADFQANGVLALAKVLGRSPRDLAEAVVASARLDDICASVEVSGPGFINLTLADGFLAGAVREMAGDARLGIPPADGPQRVVVDYSAPNVAKEMHVGHLRSTSIGDALCRILGWLGNEVTRENHVGDWGTPFGMLIEHLVDMGETAAAEELSLGDLDGFYRAARASFDADPAFAERSRARVVRLQGGDPESLRLWRLIVEESVHYFDTIYETLGVLLTDEDVVGESFYNPMLEGVVSDLDALGLLQENDGALCVFPPGFENRDGEPLPLIVRKSDGGFGYAATDLAAIRDRVDRLGATAILYVVGLPQAQHLAMCFAVARMAGWLPDGTEAVHVGFGNVLGPDGKMFKTRAGSTAKLMDLLTDAVDRAEAGLVGRYTDLEPDARAELARAIGIGAVKYADLSTDRTRDYVFDTERMVAFEGDTGPYLQYAHARIRSIFRRGGDPVPSPTTAIMVDDPHERALAVALIGLDAALRATVDGYRPSKLCNYLFDLATTFTAFFEHCPVLQAPDPDRRQSRLLLCDTTARVLREGLGLLGIESPDRM
jgi:arginyl-tRNA synthetase